MPADDDILRALNIEIGDAEAKGDRMALAALLSPKLAFLRADGSTVDDAATFLEKVQPSGSPHHCCGVE